jgi:serine-type D-Ala-D-Ala carboxypeptidase (penicillin-binding protein 5/6)
VAAVALLVAAVAAPGHLLGNNDGRGSVPKDKARSSLRDHKHRAYLSTVAWPSRGQGAYVLGDGRPVASPHQEPVPIASVAKVMTAYVVLKHHPLHPGESGPRFAVSPDDVVDTEVRRRDGQSVVAVQAGEQLSERDALMAILLPSANNVSLLVARQVSGSVAAFVAEMNETADALGMSHTTYTDPSGYDDGTVSTALDQLRLGQVVAEDQTLAAMMATRSYWLSVAGEVTNTNSLLGHDGFVGMKTGSDEAAGGCLMFRAVWPGGRELIGVVLGQRGGNLINAGLDAAKQLADRLAPDSA